MFLKKTSLWALNGENRGNAQAMCCSDNVNGGFGRVAAFINKTVLQKIRFISLALCDIFIQMNARDPTTKGRKPMKALKWLGLTALGYVVLVILFETVFLGVFQPTIESSTIKNLVITTTDRSGQSSPRKIAFVELNTRLYVSAHHWPRGWYHEAVDNPNVVIDMGNVEADYVATPVRGEEFKSVAEAFPLPLPVRFLMGFPPKRDILRLDPVASKLANP